MMMNLISPYALFVVMFFVTLLLVGCGRTPTVSQQSTTAPSTIETLAAPSGTIITEVPQGASSVSPGEQQLQHVTPSETTESQVNPTTSSQALSTPELIEQAFVKNEITAEQRLLYLAYAVYEYSSLPTQFRSNIGWRGTFVVKELHEAVTTPSVLCTINPSVRKELQRLLEESAQCDN